MIQFHCLTLLLLVYLPHNEVYNPSRVWNEKRTFVDRKLRVLYIFHVNMGLLNAAVPGKINPRTLTNKEMHMK